MQMLTEEASSILYCFPFTYERKQDKSGKNSCDAKLLELELATSGGFRLQIGLS